VRGIFAIKVSGCVPERFFFARRFCTAHVVTHGAVFRTTKNKRQPQARLPLLFSAARTKYGLLMVGAKGLEPVKNCPFLIWGNSTQKRAFGQLVSKGLSGS
jgi:hypothetical protein